MIFYIVHNIVNCYKTTWSESQKNCFTLVIGGSLHVLMYITLQYLARVYQSAYLELLSRFYGFFFLIDAVTMAIIYKLYWGRSIMNEVSDNRDQWLLDEEKHLYSRKQQEAEEIPEKSDAAEKPEKPDDPEIPEGLEVLNNSGPKEDAKEEKEPEAREEKREEARGDKDEEAREEARKEAIEEKKEEAIEEAREEEQEK